MADIVKLLLQAGADPNKTDSEGKSPLIVPVILKNEEIVKILLDNGANPASVYQLPTSEAITKLLKALPKG